MEPSRENLLQELHRLGIPADNLREPVVLQILQCVTQKMLSMPFERAVRECTQRLADTPIVKDGD